MLLLDEPFGALDAFTKEELWCVLRDLHQLQKFNVILVTHDLRESVFLADKVFVMSKNPGRFVVERKIDLPRPRDLEITYTPEFSATSCTNCAVILVLSEVAQVQTRWGNQYELKKTRSLFTADFVCCSAGALARHLQPCSVFLNSYSLAPYKSAKLWASLQALLPALLGKPFG